MDIKIEMCVTSVQRGRYYAMGYMQVDTRSQQTGGVAANHPKKKKRIQKQAGCGNSIVLDLKLTIHDMFPFQLRRKLATTFSVLCVSILNQHNFFGL